MAAFTSPFGVVHPPQVGPQKRHQMVISTIDLKFAKVQYLNYAKGALQRNELRLAINAGYNAAELLVKALVVSTKSPIALHGGLVTQFGNFGFVEIL